MRSAILHIKKQNFPNFSNPTEHLHPGADAEEISEVSRADGSGSAGITYTLREERLKRIYRKMCWGEIYDNRRTDGEQADWVKEKEVVCLRKTGMSEEYPVLSWPYFSRVPGEAA